MNLKTADPTRPADPTEPADPAEPGNMLVLGLGLWVFVLSLIFVVASALALHNARAELAADTDALALAVVNEISEEAYYTGTGIAYTDGDVYAAAEAWLTSHGIPATLTQPTGVSGDGIVVTLERTVPIPFVPSLLSAVDEVTLTTTSHARLRTM
ncbi:MAG: hypothetical protein GX483_06530 [Actinomycetaceae bacterium]|nr:hypothetical protein [Actinomycetaceae bacterium]